MSLKKKDDIEGAEVEETANSLVDEEEAKNAGQISVEIDSEVYEKIMYWIQKAKGEVSGLGKVVVEDGVFRVMSACLVKQSNTGASTEMTAEAVGKAMFELKDEPGHMNFWWHSHVNFAVFWSGTDMDTIHELGQHGWFLSTVFNKAEDRKTSFYQKGNNFTPQIFVDDIPTKIVHFVTEDTIEEWKKEFEEKVEEVTFITAGTDYSGYDTDQLYSRTWSDYDDHDNYYNPTDSYEGFRLGYSSGNIVDPDYDEIKETLMDEHDFTEEDINEMILEEINRQGVKTPRPKGGPQRGKKRRRKH